MSGLPEWMLKAAAEGSDYVLDQSTGESHASETAGVQPEAAAAPLTIEQLELMTIGEVLDQHIPIQQPPDIATIDPNWAKAPNLKALDEDLHRIEQLGESVFLPADDLAVLTGHGFTFDEELGRGSFGVVYKCRFETLEGKSYDLAAKRISVFRTQDWNDKTKTVRSIINRINAEVRILEVLKLYPNDNILRCDYVFKFYYRSKFPEPYTHVVFMEMCKGDLVNLVTEYCGNTTSIDDLHGLPYDDLRVIVHQIAAGLRFLHDETAHVQSAIAHCDLKPANIFYQLDDQNQVLIKLADFGSAIVIQRGKKVQSSVGTFMYRSPENIAAVAWDPFKNDIYATGLVAAVCFIGYGDDRFKNRFSMDAVFMIQHQAFNNFAQKFKPQDDFFKFVSVACALESNGRFATVDEMLNDQWLSGYQYAGGYVPLSVVQAGGQQPAGASREPTTGESVTRHV